MKLHLYILRLQVKSALQMIPKLILGTAVFVMLFLSIAFISSNTQKNIAANIKIAIILPENDPLVNMGFSMFSQTQNLKDYCEFVITDMDSALSMLKKGEVYAIVDIPEHFVEDVLTGVNTPAKVLLSDDKGIETTIFRAVMNAASASLSYAQAGIYALSDVFNNYNIDSEKAALVNEKANLRYIKFVLGRNNLYSKNVVYATDSIPTLQFYLCAGILSILLFIGLICGNFICLENKELLLSLSRNGISSYYITFCKVASLAIIYLPLTILLFSISGLNNIINFLNIKSVAAVLVIVLSVCSLIVFMYTIARDGLYGILIMFFANLLMLFCSGCIIPLIYLPKYIDFLSNFLPTTYIFDIFKSLITGQYNVMSFMILLLFTLIFIIFSGLIRKRGNYEF